VNVGSLRLGPLELALAAQLAERNPRWGYDACRAVADEVIARAALGGTPTKLGEDELVHRLVVLADEVVAPEHRSSMIAWSVRGRAG
jgi:hypothetical protein